jgi:hypothetical protein
MRILAPLAHGTYFELVPMNLLFVKNCFQQRDLGVRKKEGTRTRSNSTNKLVISSGIAPLTVFALVTTTKIAFHEYTEKQKRQELETLLQQINLDAKIEQAKTSHGSVVIDIISIDAKSETKLKKG